MTFFFGKKFHFQGKNFHFLVIDLVFRIFPFFSQIFRIFTMLNVVYDALLTRNILFFYSVHTFKRIRQHYFSKYLEDQCMGRPHLKFFWGDRFPSPPRSPPLYLVQRLILSFHVPIIIRPLLSARSVQLPSLFSFLLQLPPYTCPFRQSS